MKFTVTYGRKVRAKQFDMVEIMLSQEFDDEQVTWEDAYVLVRDFVEGKVKSEVSRISGEQHGEKS